MLYQLNNFELQKIAEIYKIDVSVLLERLELQDDIVEVLPFQKGLKIQTKAGQHLAVFFKNNGLKL